MDQAARIAFIQAQIVCALAEIEGMKAANTEAMAARPSVPTWKYVKGHGVRRLDTAPLPFRQDDFDAVPVRYGLQHNDVLAYLRGND